MIPAFCIRHPVITTMLTLAIAAFGVLGYLNLAVSDLPAVDFPTISVSASLPGANPETMATTVATPLEREFAAIQGVQSINSTSTLGRTSITVQFELDRDIDAAALDIQSAISAASRNLPNTLPQPPTYRKVNPAEAPILYLSLASETAPIYEVNEIAERTVAERLTTVRGVAQVDVYGAQRYAVRVQVDPDELASRGIGIDEVRQALMQANSNLPGGVLHGERKAFTIDATGELESAADYRPIIVSYRNGRPVRLDEVARVIDGVEDDKSAGWFGKQRAVTLAVQKQPGSNTVQIVDEIRELLPDIEQRIPPNVTLTPVFDRSVPIRESIRDVQITLGVTLLLVVATIFAFLRSLRATMIPSLTLPFSYLGTFAIMSLLGFSLNNLSALALTLAVGFIVDDAIVILENTVRHREMGKSRMDAAITAGRELQWTVITTSLSLLAVLIPVLFLGGVVGRLLREFAILTGVVTMVSLLVSLTLIPMLSSRYLRREKPTRRRKFYDYSEKTLVWVQDRYKGSLRWAMARGPVVMVTAGVVAVLTVWLLIRIPKGFIPPEDRGLIFAVTEAAQDVSFQEMVELQRAVTSVIEENPHVQSYSSSVGGGGPSAAGNTGRIFVRLRPEDRPHAREIIQNLRPRLAAIPGIQTFLQIPPTIRIGGQLTQSQYQFTLQGSSLEELYEWAPRVESAVAEVEGLRDVTTDLQISSPEITVQIDRDRARTLGISAEAVEQVLYSSFGQRQISTIYAQNNVHYVVLEVIPEAQRDPEALSRLYVRTDAGRLVPLDTVAKLVPTVAPISVSRFGQLPAVTVSFGLLEGVSLGDAIGRIQEATSGMNMPTTVTTTFQGEAQEFQDSFRDAGLLLAATIFIIYVVLGILYESFFHPVTILAGLPPAILGALLALMLFGKDLDLYGFVGFLLLIGVVLKEGIILVDVALDGQRDRDMAPRDAMFEGALIRFRPILMTTVAAFLGALPVASGLGAGGDVRQPLGLTAAGGLLVSQLVTLYFTPVAYVYVQRIQSKVEQWRKHQAERAEADDQDPGRELQPTR